ncbi:MAG: cell division protein FtsQ/DivIB [bacterium]
MNYKPGKKRIGLTRSKKRNRGRRTVRSFSKRGYFKNAGIFTLLILLGLGGFLGIEAVIPFVRKNINNRHFFRVKRIEIAGCVNSNSAQLKRNFPIKIGQPLFGDDTAMDRPFYKDQIWIKDVGISRRISGKVTVKVIERKPVVLVNFGKIYAVDDQGMILSSLSGNYLDLVLVSGLPYEKLEIGDTISSPDFSRTVELLKTIKETKNELYKNLSEIQRICRNEYRLFLMDKTQLLITMQDIHSQLWRYEKLKNEIDVHADHGVELDLRFGNLVFANKKT